MRTSQILLKLCFLFRRSKLSKWHGGVCGCCEIGFSAPWPSPWRSKMIISANKSTAPPKLRSHFAFYYLPLVNPTKGPDSKCQNVSIQCQHRLKLENSPRRTEKKALDLLKQLNRDKLTLVELSIRSRTTGKSAPQLN